MLAEREKGRAGWKAKIIRRHGGNSMTVYQKGKMLVLLGAVSIIRTRECPGNNLDLPKMELN